MNRPTNRRESNAPDQLGAIRRKLDWWAWKAWNRTRYYWPQAQSRKRAIANLAAFYAAHGETYRPPRPWWIP